MSGCPVIANAVITILGQLFRSQELVDRLSKAAWADLLLDGLVLVSAAPEALEGVAPFLRQMCARFETFGIRANFSGGICATGAAPGGGDKCIGGGDLFEAGGFQWSVTVDWKGQASTRRFIGLFQRGEGGAKD